MVIDFTREMLIVATEVTENAEREKIVALGQYGIDEATHTAEVAFVTVTIIRTRASAPSCSPI